MPKTSQKLALYESQLATAERLLSRRDPILHPLIKAHGPCRIRPHTRHFETLVEAIISQQLSTKVAEVIVGRFKALYTPARFPTTDEILATPSEALRAVGMSNGKVSFVKDLAAKTKDGSVRFNRMTRMSDEEITEMLLPVKGIGVWTVHMFLIFSLGRLDILPVGDLGVRKGVERLYGFDHTPTAEEIEAVAVERGWRPYCSIVSWYLWRSADLKSQS